MSVYMDIAPASAKAVILPASPHQCAVIATPVLQPFSAEVNVNPGGHYGSGSGVNRRLHEYLVILKVERPTKVEHFV